VSASAFKEEHSLAIADDEVRIVVRQPTYRRGERSPACAVVFGEPRDGCLVRVHSRCLYGDVFGSQECDCGAQLRVAMDMMRASGSGVLIYLDQEGRGAGLFAKARAYRLREQKGMDSFRSYEHYGLRPDARTYEIAGDLLKDLGLRRVTLLTNNQEKISGLEDQGIDVDREPLIAVPSSLLAADYLASKRARGHKIRGIRRWKARQAMLRHWQAIRAMRFAR
jgi:GTP cyclohydrolase II